jgi:hypothetical protein
MNFKLPPHDNGAMPVPLTEENLKRLGGGPSVQEQEEALLEKMQTLSGLLAKVNDTLEDMPSTTVPSTAGSQRERVTTAGSRPSAMEMRVGTGQRARAEAPSARASGHEPQVISLAELREKDEPVQLVNYTGSQSQLAGMSSRRKVESRAAKSEIGSLLSWGGDDSTGYYLQRRNLRDPL